MKGCRRQWSGTRNAFMRRAESLVPRRSGNEKQSGLLRGGAQRFQCMKTVRVHQDFRLLPKAYNDLFRTAENQNGVFFSAEWFMNLERAALGKEGTLRLYAVESDSTSTPLLALPMLATRQPGRFGLRKLSAFANYYTSLFGPVSFQPLSENSNSMQLLAETIARESPRWNIVDLHPLDSQAYQCVLQTLRHAGLVVQPYFCFGNWYLEVAGRSYREYFATLPSKLKNTIKRKLAQLEKNGTVNIRILTGSEDVSEGIAAFSSVYASSWKEPEPYEEFMPGLIRLCAEKGWLRLGVAYLNERPIAAQLWIVCAGVGSIYKLAYDEQFGHLSIGTILTSKLMEHVIDVDRVREVDYLTGDEPYKKDWMSHRRERWGIAAFNLRTARGMLAALRHIGGRALKRLMPPHAHQ